MVRMVDSVVMFWELWVWFDDRITCSREEGGYLALSQAVKYRWHEEFCFDCFRFYLYILCSYIKATHFSFRHLSNASILLSVEHMHPDRVTQQALHILAQQSLTTMTMSWCLQAQSFLLPQPAADRVCTSSRSTFSLIQVRRTCQGINQVGNQEL